MKKTRLTALLLCAMILTPAIASCSEKQSDDDRQNTETQAQETEVYDPLAGLDFGGQKFRVYTSAGDSNKLIEGPEEITGEVAEDAALTRNMMVEDDLKIELNFHQVSLAWDQVATNIRTLVNSADDAYDLIINDLLGMTAVSIEGAFVNVLEGEYFDFSKNYWYKPFMEDISIGRDVHYLLAGDYFIDMIRVSHCLFFNKSLMANYNIGEDVLYQTVHNQEWTLDKFNEYVTMGYSDLNGNSKYDAHDQYGLAAAEYWGDSIGFITSCNLDFIERDEDGIPTITINNEKSIEFFDKISNIYYNNATRFDGSNHINIFLDERAFFLSYLNLGSLEMLRNLEADVGLLPYPKLNENQPNYITSVHDTAELGAIPVTVTDLSFISAVIEDLCRRTQQEVLPAYYETNLKVKYTRDDESAKMVDIVHDNMDNGFPLAFDRVLGGVFMESVFSGPLTNKTNFASAYRSVERKALRELDKIINTYLDAAN